jgi:hypothetical protein
VDFQWKCLEVFVICNVSCYRDDHGIGSKGYPVGKVHSVLVLGKIDIEDFHQGVLQMLLQGKASTHHHFEVDCGQDMQNGKSHVEPHPQFEDPPN